MNCDKCGHKSTRHWYQPKRGAGFETTACRDCHKYNLYVSTYLDEPYNTDIYSMCDNTRESIEANA